MGYREDAKIDIYNLHTEWAGQPTIYIDYAEQYADAVALMMRAQEKVSVVKMEGKKRIDQRRAELDAEVRANPMLFGLEKVTETAVANAIVVAPTFKKVQDEVAQEIAAAVEEHINSVRQKELLEGVKIAFSHRKTALEKEVELFLGGYYADPKIPKSYRESQQEEVRKGVEASLEGMNKEPKVVDLGQGHGPGGVVNVAVDLPPSENRPIRRRRPGRE